MVLFDFENIFFAYIGDIVVVVVVVVVVAAESRDIYIL